MSTCDRPEALHKGLTGLIGNLNRHGRTPRLLIVDDSSDSESTKKSKDVTLSFSSAYGGQIEFVDREDRATLARNVSEEKNVPKEVIEFALLGDKTSMTTAGSVQNTFLLKTRGEKILLVDDDAIFNFFHPKIKEEPFFEIQNVFDYHFLKNNEKVSDFFETVDVDLLALHEDILGQNAATVLGEFTPDYIEDATVLDTYMGFYGDSPMESHMPLLLWPRVYEKLKGISSEEYMAIKESSRIIQSPPALTLYQGPICITLIVGIDNASLVPPFMPNGRGQDFIFGTMRWRAFPHALSAYIPILIGHERPEKEARITSYDAVREMTKMNRVFSQIIRTIPVVDTDQIQNLATIGAYLVDMGQKSPSDFSFYIQELCRKITTMSSTQIQHIADTNKNIGDLWNEDVENIARELGDADTKSFLQDVTKNESSDAILVFQKWLSLYGKLLQCWHKIIL